MLDENELLIKKNPYMALSPSLIEYFAIIGYKESFIPKILDSYKKKKNYYKPIIISSITSKSDINLIDNKLIISQIYPENPKTILIDKNSPNFESPNTSNLIYSFCFDSTDGKEKIFYVCYAFKFYEKYNYNIIKNYSEEYYIPKAFCIISQYYYFTIFEHICKNLYNLFENNNNTENKDQIPLEILVYNIVNFIPSPIFHSLQFDFFGYEKNEKGKEIRQMSGYPYLEFDLSEIFNFLPLNFVLEIYFLTFLELSIIFFCSDLELLNMVMFIMFALNYPSNDSPYYWHVVSVSKDNFVGENQFVGKFMVSFVGVNCAYNSEFNTSPFGKFHYIVDLNNKKCSLIETEELDEERDIMDFQNMKDIQIYIRNILKENKSENYFIKKNIVNLKNKLESILDSNPEYNISPKAKYVNFFKISKEIMSNNKKIQEAFYDFNINILMLLIQDYALNDSFTAIKKDEVNKSIKKINKLIKIEENNELSIEENLFLQIYRSSSKYGLYYENFIKNFETIDVLSVPLLFSEEFINERINMIKNKTGNKISLFNIMDLFFLSDRPQTLSTLNSMESTYSEKLKKYFKRFKRAKKLISFNKNVINRYIYLLNNLFEEEEIFDIFPYLRIQLSNTITSVNRKYIREAIIEYLENSQDIVPTSNFLIYSCIYIFAISISLHSYQRMLYYINDIFKSLKCADALIRHFIFILIKTFYKYYLLHDSNNISSIKMYIFMMINFLKENLIIPNEEMLKFLRNFFNKVKEEESKEKNSKRNTIDSNNDNFIKLTKENNFLCFMKYCFTSKKMFKPHNMVSVAMKENNICNMVIKTGNKSNLPIIVIKIRDYANSSLFYSPKKVYKFTKEIYNEFYDKYELDISKAKIIKIRECLINLILYGIELNKNKENLIPLDFLVNTLYLLKDFQEKQDKNKNDKKEKAKEEI